MFDSQRIGGIAGVSCLLGLATWSQAAPLQDDGPAPGVWTAQVGGEIRASEYHWSPVRGEPGVWSAPNRGQELRCNVSSAGIQVFPRATAAEDAGAWKLGLETESFGRQGFAQELPPGVLCTDGARAELSHGSITEWFENRENGIEQGWTIASAPSGSGPLWIGLALEGDLALRIEEGARSGVLVDGSGTVRLRYADLRAWDAAGRALEACLESSPEGVGIRVDDAGAAYPLTVDPALTCPAWRAEGDQVSAFFGWSVATAGDVNGDGFSDVIVSAHSFDNGQSGEGRAYVYLGSPSGLELSAAWTAEGDQKLAAFGGSVSTAGDVNGDGFSDVIVGAYQFDNGQVDEGRAYLYLGSAGGLSTSPAWTAESDQEAANFGYSASTAGDVNGDGYSDVIVGAWGFDNGQCLEGRAHVYLGSAAGLSTSPDWTAESDQVFAEFGVSVATAGDVNGDGYGDVIVGAHVFDNGQSGEGRAYLYLGSAAGLSTSPDWTAEGDQSHARFGVSVSPAGDVNRDGLGDVIVGAWLFDNGEADEGRAFVYLGSVTGLPASPVWTAESDQRGAILGNSVSAAGDVNGDGYGDVIVGDRLFDNGEDDEGRAMVYLGTASGLSPSPGWTAESNQADARFGSAVATAGDVNGDGYSDLIVGARRFTSGETDEGGAFVYLGSPQGPSCSGVFPGDGINADKVVPLDAVIGSPWAAPVQLGHPHGAGGPLALKIRSATLNGTNFSSPLGGRLTEVLITGSPLATISGSHNGTVGDIPLQMIPSSSSLVGLSWAAQYTVVGGGFADLSQAVFGVIGSCP